MKRSLGLLSRYQSLTESSSTFLKDPHQIRALETLERIGEQILSQSAPIPRNTLHPSQRQGWSSSILNIFQTKPKPTPPTQNLHQGVYLHGGVGCGKTMVMDMFYNALVEENVPTNRTHFHSFMLDVHQRLHTLRSASGAFQHPDPLPKIAQQLVSEHWVICFDEMLVMDVADAMILRQLFAALMDEGVYFVATSNAAPRSLYHNGINRPSFLPFVDMIEQKCIVHDMNSRTDYRSIQANAHEENHNQNQNGKITHQEHDKEKVLEFLKVDPSRAQSKILRLASGREFRVNECYETKEGKVCSFPFRELFGQKLASSAAEYISLGEHFDTILVHDFPVLGSADVSMGRRFMVALDLWYDLKTNIVITAEAEPDLIFKELEHSQFGGAHDEGEGDKNRNLHIVKDFHQHPPHNAIKISAKHDEKLLFRRATSRLRQLHREGKFFVHTKYPHQHERH